MRYDKGIRNETNCRDAWKPKDSCCLLGECKESVLVVETETCASEHFV